LSEERKIGEGIYGKVYSGQLNSQEVAIKVMKGKSSQGSNFRKEAKVKSSV